MATAAVIPPNERYPRLKEFLLGQAQTIQRVKEQFRQLIPEQSSPFLYLSYPWIAEPSNPEQERLVATRRAQIQEAGFDGATVRAGLEEILQQDRHLRNCCVGAGQLAHFLDMAFVSPAAQQLMGGGTVENIGHLYDQFLLLTYGQGRFRAFSLSHIFNFDSDEPSLRFGDVRVEKLDGTTISNILGEFTVASFIHPFGGGDYFIVTEREGPCDDHVRFIFEEQDRAETFVQVLQYFKDGIVHVDYSVPHFLPQWVNQIRKLGIFYVGSPRRYAYDQGRRLYRVNRDEVEQITHWWTTYQSPDIAGHLADEQHTMRKAGLRAGEYYELSHTQASAVDRLLNLAISLEALFSPDERGEFNFRISQNISQLVGTTPEERVRIFREFKRFYDRRSKLVHGQYDVAAFYEGRFVTHEECDQWASDIRQAILRFLVLYLRGSNERTDVLRELTEAALDASVAETLREQSDPQRFLTELGV